MQEEGRVAGWQWREDALRGSRNLRPCAKHSGVHHTCSLSPISPRGRHRDADTMTALHSAPGQASEGENGEEDVARGLLEGTLSSPGP